MRFALFSWRRRARLPCALAFLLTAGIAVAAPSPTPHPSPAPGGQPPAASPAASALAAATPTPAPGLALSEIAPQAQTTLARLKGFEPEGAPDQVASVVQNALPDLSKEINGLRDQSGKASENVGGSLDELRNLQRAWDKLEATLTDHSTALGDRGRTLDDESRQVEGIIKLWQNTKADTQGKEVNAPAETLDSVREVLYNAAVTQVRIKYRQTAILDLQNRVRPLLDQIDAGQDIVTQALNAALKTLFVRESAPLWTQDAQPAPGLPGRWRATFGDQKTRSAEYAEAHSTLFAVHAAVFLALLGVFLWLRRIVHQWTEDEPHLKRAIPIFDVPIATALVVSFLLLGGRYAGAPNLVTATVSVVALLPTIVLLRRLLARRLYAVLWSLAVFTVLDQVRVAITTLPTINRWLFCGEMLGAIGVFLFLIWLQRRSDAAARKSLGRWIPALFVVAVAVLATALGANVLGYVRFGTLLGTAALQSSYTAVFLYALLRVLDGLTVITLRVKPVSASRIAQFHRDQVQTQIYGAFRLAAIFLWLKYTLEQVQLYTQLYTGARDVLTHEVPLGSFSVSLGELLGFAVAIWLSSLISRVVRFFLNEEVYERVQLAPGLPYAISTIINYSVLLVGFIVALAQLGVHLTQITIVAGAFSVGLGFGLQNIINNFVSGIILLFERPVKVGDVIQYGDATGEVRRIGIRASIIRTRDGSDIILPNGNLISNQVTNWTYADRRRAVEVPLTIAPGPDLNQVMQALKTAATKEPVTEDNPAPEVYITGITAAGVNLIVRAWTHRYEDWIEARSELNAALLVTLTRENIRLV